MKWNGYKGLWVTEGREGYIPCILQIQLNEGRETKAAFQGSFWLRWPSETFDDVAAEKCSLCRMQPSIWETPIVCCPEDSADITSLIGDNDQEWANFKNWNFSGFTNSLRTFVITQVHNCMTYITLCKSFFVWIFYGEKLTYCAFKRWITKRWSVYVKLSMAAFKLSSIPLYSAQFRVFQSGGAHNHSGRNHKRSFNPIMHCEGHAELFLEPQQKTV